MSFLSKHSDTVYALLRVVAGFMFLFHGAQKLFGLFGDPNMMPPAGSQMWIGGIIELVAGVLVMIGLWTRWAAFVASGEMAVAYFQFHWKFAFTNAFFPIVNHGEMAVLYCFVFLYIATNGAGKWSFDGSMGKKKK
ncbi:MAG TPA: DoxX family protein [bacterium]|nr:DoxX family protein [bacterium]